MSVYLIKMGDLHARCLAPEILAAYVDRGLSLAERSRVDHHLASCPQCLALVAGVVRTVADVSELMPHAGPAVETASRAATRRTLVGMLAAAAAVIAVLSAPSLVRPWLDRDAGLVNLVGVGEQRSVLGRLTGGLPHAPLGVPSAGGQGGRAAETDRILLTAAKIRESFGERETPSRLHELGLAQLLAGQYDAAAQDLLAASREQPANAHYLNDVAAVQLERARLGLRPDDLPRALASADRARRLDPSLNEAWFNRALAATALSLNEYAKTAWTEYLARDSSSAWALEARTRLADLARPTPAAAWSGIEQRLGGAIDTALADEAVRTQTTEARNFLETKLFVVWAAAVQAGRDGAPALDRIRLMADAFSRVAGDALYVDAVAAIQSADSRGARAVVALARAHTSYAEAAALFSEDRFSDAAPGLTAARAGFSAGGSPFADRAALDIATIFYVGGKAAEAEALLESIGRTARQSGYAYNGGRASWVQGLLAVNQGRLGEAQSLYEATLDAFERMGDAELAAFAHNLLASLHFYLGDKANEWRHRLAALDGLKITRSHRVRHSILAGTAASLRTDSPETALTTLGAVLENAASWGRDAAIAEGLAQRGAVALELGRSADAHADLRQARATLDRVPDRQFRDRIEVAILSTESDLFRASDPAASAAAATRAIAIVEQRRDRLRLAQLNLRLAQANVVWGNLIAADAALGRGLNAFNDERATLSDEGRLSTQDESWRLFDTAVQLAIKKGDYPRAFALSEQARTRSLAESRSAMAGRTLAEVQASLGAGDALLSLSQFDDELAVWVIRRGGTSVTMRPVTRRDAERLVARQHDEIRFEAAEPDASADLYNQIIRPITSQLKGVNRLSVVSDSTFAGAAFAAFWDRSSRQFLIERFQVNAAPHASLVAATTVRGNRRIGTPLILGGPDEQSDADARAVATAYANPELLTGRQATGSRLLVPAADRPIVHIAARTVENRAYPFLSRVLLADDEDRPYSGGVMGRDIVARPVGNARLVVLDCAVSTAPAEGASNLTRAFLTAGVPAVLATLPGADETATRQLMVGFHRLMSTGITADDALNQLQRNVLRSNGRRLGAWSALVLYGSDR